MTWNMFHSTALEIPSFYDVLRMPDALLLASDNSNGITYRIVVLIFPYLLDLSPIDVVHSSVPSAFLPNESFASSHSGPTSIYGYGYECDCYSPWMENDKCN